MRIRTKRKFRRFRPRVEGMLRVAPHRGIESKHPTRFVLVLSPEGTVLVLVLESSAANVAGGLEYEHRFEYEYRRFAAEYEYEYDWHSCAPREAVRDK